MFWFRRTALTSNARALPLDPWKIAYVFAETRAETTNRRFGATLGG
jgi:hypothetical protein